MIATGMSQGTTRTGIGMIAAAMEVEMTATEAIGRGMIGVEGTGRIDGTTEAAAMGEIDGTTTALEIGPGTGTKIEIEAHETATGTLTAAATTADEMIVRPKT